MTEVESAQSGLAVGTEAEFLVVPAAQFPAESWQYLLDRFPVAFAVDLEGDEVTAVGVEAGNAITGLAVEITPERVTTSLAPVPRLVVAGQGPIADALVEQGRLLGWKVVADPRPDTVAGFVAALSPLDAVVVMGHDVETSSRCLMSALESDAGYVGALGSRAMQQSRADWLAYRDVTDLSGCTVQRVSTSVRAARGRSPSRSSPRSSGFLPGPSSPIWARRACDLGYVAGVRSVGGDWKESPWQSSPPATKVVVRVSTPWLRTHRRRARAPRCGRGRSSSIS